MFYVQLIMLFSLISIWEMPYKDRREGNWWLDLLSSLVLVGWVCITLVSSIPTASISNQQCRMVCRVCSKLESTITQSKLEWLFQIIQTLLVLQQNRTKLFKATPTIVQLNRYLENERVTMSAPCEYSFISQSICWTYSYSHENSKLWENNLQRFGTVHR